MRYYPTTQEEKEDLIEECGHPVPEWMISPLKKNPGYNHWGNFEDYMSDKGEGWTSRIEHDSWESFYSSFKGSDTDYNKFVNFYFEVEREAETCKDCEGSGNNEATRKLSDSWYNFEGTRDWMPATNSCGVNTRYDNNAWQNHLTELEVRALQKRGRLGDLFNGFFDEEENQWYEWREGEKVVIEEPDSLNPDEVNEYFLKEPLGHDSINQHICVKTRAESLGVYGPCEKCKGKGTIFIEPEATLRLQLWLLHPRKGASRGVYVNNIKEADLPQVFEWLKEQKRLFNEDWANI